MFWRVAGDDEEAMVRIPMSRKANGDVEEMA
jgi:hypothetical protein